MNDHPENNLFPIMALGYRASEEIDQLRKWGVPSVIIGLPWAMIAPHEAQARDNHGGQTLKRLAERGGLGVCEAVAVLEDRRWRAMPRMEAHKQLAALLAAYKADAVAVAAE